MRFPYKADAHNISFPALLEKRDSNSYTDARVFAALTDAEGASATVHKTAALEAAAGLYAFCLAGAGVTPALPALTPACLVPACPWPYSQRGVFVP